MIKQTNPIIAEIDSCSHRVQKVHAVKSAQVGLPAAVAQRNLPSVFVISQAKETPHHIAARIPGAEQCVDMLIRCGADVNNYKEVGKHHCMSSYIHYYLMGVTDITAFTAVTI